MNWEWAQEVVKSMPVRRIIWSPGWRISSGSDGKLVYSNPAKGKPTTFVPMQLDKDATDWVHLDPAAARAAEAAKARKAKAPAKRKGKGK
jgi:hypothetical protein